MKKLTFCSSAALTVAGIAWSEAALHGEGHRPAVAFEDLRMHIEVDLPSQAAGSGSPLDLRAEVVFEASSQVRLASLRVLDSSRKPRFSFESPNASTLGVSEVALEYEGSLRDVRREYPAGEYIVEATTLDGELVGGTVSLSHAFPGRFLVLSPQPADLVDAADATIAWTPAPGAKSYTLEIEHDASGFQLEIVLPPWQTHFTAGGPMLRPGETYEYSLAVQGDTDNELEYEGSFTTAPFQRTVTPPAPH